MRWSQEVTHREAREHLGVETQHQWSGLAIERSTPLLFGIYSLAQYELELPDCDNIERYHRTHEFF